MLKGVKEKSIVCLVCSVKGRTGVSLVFLAQYLVCKGDSKALHTYTYIGMHCTYMCVVCKREKIELHVTHKGIH